jgi:hypothetical protein
VHKQQYQQLGSTNKATLVQWAQHGGQNDPILSAIQEK